ncbi:hypothetical protein RYX36_003523 [Vicia faba]
MISCGSNCRLYGTAQVDLHPWGRYWEKVGGDGYAEVATIVRKYGSMYLRLGDLQMALEYYAQDAAAVGGGKLSWTGRGNVDQQRQRNLMLKHLLTELLLRDGGIYLLLGTRGAGEEES